MSKVYPNGNSGDVTIPATESIAVFTTGVAKVYRKVGYANHPDTVTLLGEVNNEQTVFGSYASGATIIIEAGADEVTYSVGVGPSNGAILQTRYQGDPGVLNATGALTAAMMLSGIVTSTTGAAVAGTVPTGTVMDAALDYAIGDSFDWAVNATGANAFTVTTATDHTLVGNMVVASGKAGLFRTRKTAANTYVTYSLSNT